MVTHTTGQENGAHAKEGILRRIWRGWQDLSDMYIQPYGGYSLREGSPNYGPNHEDRRHGAKPRTESSAAVQPPATSTANATSVSEPVQASPAPKSSERRRHSDEDRSDASTDSHMSGFRDGLMGRAR